MTTSLHGVSLKKIWGKLKKMGVRFIVVDPAAEPAKTHGGQDIDKSLREPRAELQPQLRKGSNKQFTKN